MVRHIRPFIIWLLLAFPFYLPFLPNLPLILNGPWTHHALWDFVTLHRFSPQHFLLSKFPFSLQTLDKALPLRIIAWLIELARWALCSFVDSSLCHILSWLPIIHLLFPWTTSFLLTLFPLSFTSVSMYFAQHRAQSGCLIRDCWIDIKLNVRSFKLQTRIK